MIAISHDSHNKHCVAYVVDDDRAIRKLLRIALQSQDYRVVECDFPLFGLDEISRKKSDIILIDPNLESTAGLGFITRYGQMTSAPLLVLSSSAHGHHIVSALDAGADDYVIKPFHVPELLARMRAPRRRAVARVTDKSVYRLGDLQIDLIRKLA